MPTSFFLDGLIVVLLAATIGFCVVLNRRLGALRRAQSELEQFAQTLNEVTSQAQQGIEGLKAATEELGGSLQGKIDKAETLNSDLAFMTKHGSDLANRLESAVRGTRRTRPVNGAGTGAKRNDADQELLDALRTVR